MLRLEDNEEQLAAEKRRSLDLSSIIENAKVHQWRSRADLKVARHSVGEAE